MKKSDIKQCLVSNRQRSNPKLHVRLIISILVGFPGIFSKANLSQAAFRCVEPTSVMGLCDAM